jgi:acyl carrier protein
MLGLVTFVEKTCGVEFTALELTIDQFDTIADVTRLVAGKRRAVSA